MKNVISRNALKKAWVGFAALSVLAGCAATTGSTGLASGGFASVDLRVSTTEHPNEVYEARTAIQVPEDHTIGDHIFPYEGIGWENEIIGYRLYLDERAVTDIFGKRLPAPVLATVDYRSKYHDLADWGMDVQHVGPSMGVGGLGLYRGDSLERFGSDGELFAEVVKQSGSEVSFKVKHRNVPVEAGVTANVDTLYSLKSGSPLTWVTVNSTVPANRLATGLVNAAGNKRYMNSNKLKKGEWRYIATWGDKASDVKDGLGTVLFFKQGEAQLRPTVNKAFPIRFKTSNPTYAFAGVWEQGPMGITDKDSFIAWVDAEQAKLNK